MEGARALAEVYGFVLWVASFVFYAIFILWAYLPERVLIEAGITYYPSKWWGIALPSYLLVTLTLAVLFYWGFNMRHTNPLDSLHAITDSFARSEERPSAAAALGDARQVPELYDLPISLVSRALHSRRVAHSAGDVDDFVGNGDEGDDDAYSDDDPGG